MQTLSKQVLEANEQHKNALDEYIRNIRAELDSVNKLIAAVENLSDDNLQEDHGEKWCLHADGALKPINIIDHTQILNERSPFFTEALRRERYGRCLIPNAFSLSEKTSLQKAIIKENKRITALRAQQSGQNGFEEIANLGDLSFLDNLEGINWEYIAREVSASNNNSVRSAQECKIQWLGRQQPKINSQRWSEEEDGRLHDLVESKRESGPLDWEEISTLLETNRTALDCIKRFLASTRPIIRWTRALDDKLHEAVEKYGVKNWVPVAASVSPTVSANQCQIRYERSLNPEIKRGRFNAEEDELLMEAIEVHGTDWTMVAQAVPGRTNAQCRARYTIHLDPNAKRPWDAEEDSKLKAAVSKYGEQWDKVREEMGATRSQKQYASRYRNLTRLEAQDMECLDLPQPPLVSPQSASQTSIETRTWTGEATASQAITMHSGGAEGPEVSANPSNVIDTNSEMTGEETSNYIAAPVEMGLELDTRQKKTGTNPEITSEESHGLIAVPVETAGELKIIQTIPTNLEITGEERSDSIAVSTGELNIIQVTPTYPETTGEERSNSIAAPAQLAGELKTKQKRRGRKRKVPPSIAEPDREMDSMAAASGGRGQHTSPMTPGPSSTHPMTTRTAKRRKQA